MQFNKHKLRITVLYSSIGRVHDSEPARHKLMVETVATNTSNILLKPKPFGLAKSHNVPMSGRPRGPGTSENGFRCCTDVIVDSHLLMTLSDDVFVT